MQQIKNIITNLSIEELKILQEDLKAHNYTLKLINEILEKYNESKKVCASCGAPIDVFSKEKMVLTFGSPDFEKKAYFCACDCMRYFLERLNSVKNKTKTKF